MLVNVNYLKEKLKNYTDNDKYKSSTFKEVQYNCSAHRSAHLFIIATE